MTCFILIFIQSFYFLFLLRLLWPMDYLEVYCLISTFLDLFLIVFYYRLLIWSHYLYNFNFLKFVEVYFIAQGIIYHKYLNRNTYIWVLNEISICVNYFPLIIMLFIESLLIFCLVVPEREVLQVPSYIVHILLLLLALSVFVSNTWKLCCFVSWWMTIKFFYLQ